MQIRNQPPKLPADGFKGNYKLAVTQEREIEACYDLTTTVAPADCEGWLVLIPIAPETPFQSKVTMDFSLPSSVSTARPLQTRERSHLHRPILQTQVPALTDAEKGKIAVRIIYRATMSSRQLVPSDSPSPTLTLSHSEESLFTRATTTCDFMSSAVRRWITQNDMVRKDDEAVLPFAFRVYQHLQSSLSYIAPLPGDFWKCTATTGRGTGDCGASNLLFCGVMRYNKIPARTYCGRWSFAGSPRTGSQTSHSKGEFWVDGIGWIPIDATAPERNKPNQRDPALDFGFDAGWFFATHLEPDLIVDQPGYATASLTWMHQRIVPYRGGDPHTWDGFQMEETWTTSHLRDLSGSWCVRNAIRS